MSAVGSGANHKDKFFAAGARQLAETVEIRVRRGVNLARQLAETVAGLNQSVATLNEGRRYKINRSCWKPDDTYVDGLDVVLVYDVWHDPTKPPWAGVGESTPRRRGR